MQTQLEGSQAVESVEAQKSRLFAAACGARSNEQWEARGLQRLHFGHPENSTIVGCVEIDAGSAPVKFARVEAFVPVAMAEQLIRFVAGDANALGTRKEDAIEDDSLPQRTIVVEEPKVVVAKLRPTSDPAPGDDTEDRDEGLPAEVTFAETQIAEVRA